MAENMPNEVVVCAKTGSVLWAKDAYYLDGLPYRPEVAPKGAVPFGRPVEPALDVSVPAAQPEVKGKIGG